MDPDSDVTLLLDRQQLRRHQGIPSLTVFVGPVGVAVSVWKKWNGSRPVAMPPRKEPRFLVSSWTAAAIASGALRAGAVRWFAKATGLSPSDTETRWLTHTPHDLHHALEGISTSDYDAVALCRQLLATDPKLDSANAGSMAESLCAASRAQGESAEAYFAGVASLMSSDKVPAILLIPERETVESSVRFLCSLLGAAPGLPVALAIPDDVADSALKQTPEDRWLAVLREGIVRVAGVKRETIVARLESAGVGPHDLSASLDVLVAGGTSPDAVDQFVKAAQALIPTANEEDEDCARSSAEQFLFELLESLPQTSGLFQLNQKLEFRHGPQAAEADLLAADYKLVVEIDGSYYHLSSKDAYRRDRRKDWLFQQHGYQVLRFLADDVVAHLEEILNTIVEALETRRADPNQKGLSP